MFKRALQGALALALALSLAGLAVAQDAAPADEKPIVPTAKIDLFNGKDLSGWKPFLKDEKADPTATFSVKDGVIAVTGTPPGYIATDKSYADYKLHVEWRWVPVEGKEPKGRNSGVLVHMDGKDAVWPKSLECQLMSGNAGDFFVIGGVTFKAFEEAKAAAVAAAGDDEGKKKKAANNRRSPRMGESNEKPIGEWNTYEIVCKGDSVIPSINGEKKNEATGLSVSSGRICLQSEGAPIEFRNVTIEPVQ